MSPIHHSAKPSQMVILQTNMLTDFILFTFVEENNYKS